MTTDDGFRDVCLTSTSDAEAAFWPSIVSILRAYDEPERCVRIVALAEKRRPSIHAVRVAAQYLRDQGWACTGDSHLGSWSHPFHASELITTTYSLQSACISQLTFR